MNAIEQYFHLVLFIMLYKVPLTIKTVDETNSNESYWVVIPYVTVAICFSSSFKINLDFLLFLENLRISYVRIDWARSYCFLASGNSLKQENDKRTWQLLECSCCFLIGQSESETPRVLNRLSTNNDNCSSSVRITSWVTYPVKHPLQGIPAARFGISPEKNTRNIHSWKFVSITN